MITLIAATMLSMAAAKADPVDDARKVYYTCMIELHNTSMKAKMPPADFTKTAETGCAEQREAFHVIVVKSEKGYGSSTADAEDFAKTEMQEIVDNIVASFNDNSETGATITPPR